MLTSLKTMFLVVRHGEWREILQELRRRIWSSEVSYCLRRDLAQPFEAPRSRVEFTIREIRPTDHSEILRERPRRLPILRKNVPTCYVAITDTGAIAYMQWLFGPTSNDAIRQIFGGCVLPLQPDEALLEFAYTFVDWRGKFLMPRAMALIAEKAQEIGCRHVITFVREENTPAIKGCLRAGFSLYRKQTVIWRLFRRVRIERTDLPADTSLPVEGSPPKLGG